MAQIELKDISKRFTVPSGLREITPPFDLCFTEKPIGWRL